MAKREIMHTLIGMERVEEIAKAVGLNIPTQKQRRP